VVNDTRYSDFTNILNHKYIKSDIQIPLIFKA